MLRLVLDCETNGLVHQLDKVHSLVLRDIDTGHVYSCSNHDDYEPIVNGIHLISQADLLIGHNVINFDFRALKKVYSHLTRKPGSVICDTLIMSRVLWPELEPVDEQKFSHIESKYKGKHSLGAWGDRLNVNKSDFPVADGEEKWDKWTPEMQKYCENDTLVSLELYNYLKSQE